MSDDEPTRDDRWESIYAESRLDDIFPGRRRVIMRIESVNGETYYQINCLANESGSDPEYTLNYFRALCDQMVEDMDVELPPNIATIGLCKNCLHPIGVSRRRDGRGWPWIHTNGRYHCIPSGEPLEYKHKAEPE